MLLCWPLSTQSARKMKVKWRSILLWTKWLNKLTFCPFCLLFVTLRKTDMIQLFQDIGTRNNTTHFFPSQMFFSVKFTKKPSVSFCCASFELIVILYTYWHIVLLQPWLWGFLAHYQSCAAFFGAVMQCLLPFSMDLDIDCHGNGFVSALEKSFNLIVITKLLSDLFWSEP